MMKETFVTTYCELDYLKEDLFQGNYKNFTLDVGYYGNGFLKLVVIKDYDWDNPLEEVSFLDAKLIEPFIEIFKEKLENGYYEGNYVVNKGYEKEL